MDDFEKSQIRHLMIGFDPLDRLSRTEEHPHRGGLGYEPFAKKPEVFCIYVDDLFDSERMNAFGEMKAGFDELVGEKFHILFPMKSEGFSADAQPTTSNFNVEASQRIIEAFRLNDAGMPMLLFPSVRDGELLLTIPLDHRDVGDAIKRVREISKVIIGQEPDPNMSPEEFRANTVRIIQNANMSGLFDQATLATGAFLFVTYTPEAIELLVRILAGS